MKKQILNNVKYEENPWGKNVDTGKIVCDFLPPTSVLKKAKVIIIKENPAFSVPIQMDDAENLLIKSYQAGLSPEAFVIGVLHDFLTGKLVRPNA
jgi:hypothetical protein